MLSAAKFMAIAALLAGLTSAQSEGDLPTCAQTCVTQFTSGSSIGGCSGIDVKCICSNQSFLGNIACCLAGACDTADQQAATNFALSFCKAGGVTGLPTAVSCSSTIVSSSTSSASSSATGATTTPASGSSSVGSSAASVTSSIESSLSSVASSITSAGSSKASSSSSASSASATTKNAAPHNVAGMGAGVLGGLAAAVALL